MRNGVFRFYTSLSVRAKMALSVSAAFVLLFLLASFIALAYFERERKATLMAHTFAVVSTIAEDIDSKLKLVHRGLIDVAASVPIVVMQDPDAAQAFLDRQTVLHTLFDNGLFLISLEGKLIAESPVKPDRRGRDISAREFYQRTIATKHPYISKPYRSTHNPGKPALIMTAPVFTPDGKLVGLIEGSFDLVGRNNFFAEIAKTHFGTSGYLYLSDGRDAMISHPDKNRIMMPPAQPNQNALFDRALEGFEGSGESLTSYGVAVLSSFKRISSTGWILGSNYPIAEAYAPIYEARRYFLLATGLGTALMLAAVWLLMLRLTGPLLRMTLQVKQIGLGHGARHRVNVDSHDEIGALAETFNASLDLLERQREERDRLASILETTTDLVATIDLQRNITFLNRAGRAMIGIGDKPLSGLRLSDFHPAWAAVLVTTQGIPLAIRDGTWSGETAVLGPDGWEIPVSQVVISHRDACGDRHYMSTVMRDITERKRAEAELHVAATAFESQQGMMITDANSVILRVNRAFTEITGYTPAEAVGQTPRLLKSDRHNADFYVAMWETVLRAGGWQGEIWDRRKNGQVYPKWLTISAVKDNVGAITHYIGTHYDITERKNAETAMLNLNRDLSESRQRLRELAAQNEVRREGERKHIAQEVHDELGQVLTALRMDLSLLSMRFGSIDPAVNDKVLDMKRLVDRAILGVRNVAVNLRPTALDMGLVPALEWLCNEFTKQTTIACVIDAGEENIDLDETRSVVIFRIVQESLTNVTRYAQASQVEITLGLRGHELGLEIRDNGRGFDLAAAAKRKSFGLLGMRERALALGGHVDIISAAGQGTVIGVSIPIDLDIAKDTS